MGLQLKCENEGTHATFLEIDILVKENIYEYKLFDKPDDFPFSIVRMPDLTGNIPSSMFYGSIMSEFLRIARCALLLSDFVPRAKKLFLRMTTQGGTKNRVLQQIKKVVLRHPGPFKKYQTESNTIISLITS